MTKGISLADKVAFLRNPASYPHPVTEVRAIETHMSWVFVTDTLVYKMKKPVHLSYINFSTLQDRRHYCEESIRLNRRLAPDVYLSVVPLVAQSGGGLALDGEGRPVEWLEKMRRLPEAQMLDTALAEGRVSEADVRRFATVLAEFYRRLPAEPMAPASYRERLVRDIEDNRRALAAYPLDAPSLETVTRRQLELVEGAELLDERVAAGRVVEGHGDLRPEHVCLLPEPVFIDCLEFNREFRILDVADELSYLAMECELLDAPFVGPLLFDTYQCSTGDRVPPRLIHFYQSFRALVRAKLAAWHLKDHPPDSHGKWLRRAADYLALADRHAAELVQPR